MSDPIIQFDHFSFQYHAQAEPTLHDITLSIRKGEKVLICGPSGCGKSTLAHCINGLIPHSYRGESTGRVSVGGRETKDIGLFEISRTVGTVLQDTDGQFVGMTVAEDIAFALENDCVVDPALHERVEKAARAVGVETHLSHAPGDLSGGQKQRVSLAGILVDDVEVLLFDEPLANLDPATGKAAIELIDEIGQQTGAAVVIIEHRLEDVLHRHMDRVILMGGGRILADVTPDELLAGSLLKENGIREPLYVTALKYAGVPITAQAHPDSIEHMLLSESDKAAVRDWFCRTPPAPQSPERETQLAVKDLRFAYDNGREALHGISLSVRQGELGAIVGTNGAGKSTYCKLICGFEKQQSGTIALSGCDWALLSIKERADHVGYVMQNPNQMISQTLIFDEVALGLRTRGAAEDEVKARVEKTLKICGLWPFRSWPVSALSFGQKKRVTIAAILVLEPEIILLDEPTAGQDYRHYTEIMEFLLDLNRRGVTVLMVTHDMHLMLEYARRAFVFSDGRLIADAPCAEILTDDEIIRRASLKETSLYTLAKRCGIEDARAFVARFIDYEREAAHR